MLGLGLNIYRVNFTGSTSSDSETHVFLLAGQSNMVGRPTFDGGAGYPSGTLQYPQATGLGYPFATMQAIFDAVPSIVAIKDWCNDPMLHEKHIRNFQSRQRPVNVLTTHSSWLMASLSMGPAGLLSGAGSVIADLQVALFEAIQAHDLAAARAANDRIYPLAQAFYRAPFLDMHNRMKVCLQLLGRIDAAFVRPPLMPLTSAEIEELKAALVASGLLPDA